MRSRCYLCAPMAVCIMCLLLKSCVVVCICIFSVLCVSSLFLSLCFVLMCLLVVMLWLVASDACLIGNWNSGRIASVLLRCVRAIRFLLSVVASLVLVLEAYQRSFMARTRIDVFISFFHFFCILLVSPLCFASSSSASRRSLLWILALKVGFVALFFVS